MNHRDQQFTQFVRERSGRLLVVARAICGDATTAEDLVQSALEKAYVHWSRANRGGDPFPYVRRILVNLNIDRYRRGREVPYALVPDRPTRDLTSRTDDELAVSAALAGLTPRERAVVVLRYLEDLSELETARELRIARGTVKSACNPSGRVPGPGHADRER